MERPLVQNLDPGLPGSISVYSSRIPASAPASQAV